jgi:tRNA pseudouridine13 synthase
MPKGRPFKLKEHPEDFQVEELTDLMPSDQGPFALYRLEKRDWTTPDALHVIRQRWQIELRRFSYGGLKDRHAQTVQYLTIFHGPQRNLSHHGVILRYLGQVTAPYTSKDIRANHFRITLRALSSTAVAAAERVLDEVRVEGVPNYFDDQRFGSVGDNDEFVARYLVLGRYEEALRLALTAPYAYDRAPQKREKAILRSHWGDWTTCKALLPHGYAGRLVDYLISHPDDFCGAVARLKPELRGLYLSAYQSYLWNRILAQWLLQRYRPEQIVWIHLRLGRVPMHRGLDEAQRTELARLQLPLPSARLKIEASDPRAALIEAVLAEEGFGLHEMKIKGLREPFFSKGDRPALCLPSGLQQTAEPDERHPGCQKLVLDFELPRGCYATLIVKRIQESG